MNEQRALPSEPTAETVVEVSNLEVWYGPRQILHDIDLAVYPKEVLVIMGGSGSGKSTLLRHILGLERPRRGTVKLLGVDLNQCDALTRLAVRKQIGVAFQGGALFSSLTVAENVMLPMRELTKLPESTMEIMMRMKLEVVNMGHAENLLPAELSGGMIKRAAIARAIALDPKLLFFDEPSAGLDPVVAAQVDELIIRLKNTVGMSIVVVTHELESAFRIADRICVLDGGKIIALGNVDAVRHDPNPRVQNLLNRRLAPKDLDAEEYLTRLTAAKGRK